MPIIAVSNQKGGVGKTTSTLNLGAALREMGKRVLLVDLDPQGSLTVAAGILDVDNIQTSIGDLLIARAQDAPSDISRAITISPSGLGAGPRQRHAERRRNHPGRRREPRSHLTQTLQPILDRYDYVLIDCLPSLGLIAINALRAATGVVIPVQADFLAVQGLAQILETKGAVRSQLNPGLAIYGVLLTMVDARKTHAQRVVATVRHSLNGQVPVFSTEIAQHVALKEAAEAGQSVLRYDSRSSAASMYRDLAREVARAAGDLSVMVEPRSHGMFGFWRNLTRSRGAQTGATEARAA